jgi:putative transposase
MSEDTTPAPEWLKNVNLAAQHLTRLSLETAAQASLITRAENNWAYAGELPQSAVDEITRTVAHYFGDGGSGDLARFIRLETMDSEYMLYATGLGGDFVLALVFDAETPFSKIRTQANSLAASLAATPPADILEDTQSSPVEAEAEIEQELDENVAPQPLWDSIPPPIPTDWLPEEKTVSRVERMLDDLINEDFSPAVSPMENPFTRKEAKPERVEKRQVEVAMQAETDEKPELEQTVVSSLRTLPEHLADTMVSESTLEATNAETAEFSAETMVSRSAQPEIELPPMAVEPATPAMYNLVYACVLVPRMPHHYLTGDLSNNLSEWLTQLALAFGWRLEQLSIRPEYIQWLINVPPKTSPGYLMRIMRQHLSRRIFKEFPRLAEDNPSGDFWAPGYLIISSNQAPPAKLIADFINETRNRQGAGGKF